MLSEASVPYRKKRYEAGRFLRSGLFEGGRRTTRHGCGSISRRTRAPCGDEPLSFAPAFAGASRADCPHGQSKSSDAGARKTRPHSVIGLTHARLAEGDPWILDFLVTKSIRPASAWNGSARSLRAAITRSVPCLPLPHVIFQSAGSDKQATNDRFDGRKPVLILTS
jgi:hypothetical protein